MWWTRNDLLSFGDGMLQGAWKQHLRPRVVVGYGVKIVLPSPLNYVTRSPGLVDHLEANEILANQPP